MDVDGHTRDGTDSPVAALDGSEEVGAGSDAALKEAASGDATSTNDAAMDASSDGAPAPVCGDGLCQHGETSQTCPRDCVLSCGSVVVDLSQGLMWEVAPSSFVAWPAAKTFCTSMTTGGYTDWALPSYSDYETLLGSCVTDTFLGGGAEQCNTCATSLACSAMFPGDQQVYWNSATYGTCCAGGADFLEGTLEVGYYQDGSGGELRTRCDRLVNGCSACLPSEVCSPAKPVCVPATCSLSDAGP